MSSNLVENIFNKSSSFLVEKGLKLEEIIRLIDYTLNTIDIDVKEDNQLQTYLNSIKYINSLLMLLGYNKLFEEGDEQLVFSFGVIEMLFKNPSRIAKYREFRKELYAKYFPNTVSRFEEFKEAVTS